MLSGLNIEGNTALHRMPVRAKLVLLLLAGPALYLMSSFVILVPVFLVAAAVYATTGLSLREGVSRLKPVVVTLLILLLATAYFTSPVEAAQSFLRLMSVILLAGAITATTPTGDFIDEITWLLRPLEKLGLMQAADVGLAVGLVLRFVPDIFDRYEAITEAHRARGLKARPFTVLAPLIILTLRDADAIAMAIDARGFRRRRSARRR